MNVYVSSVTVVRNTGGCDHLYLKTDLPCGTWPYQGEATLKLEVAGGSAELYLAEHFPGVPMKIVDAEKLSTVVEQ